MEGCPGLAGAKIAAKLPEHVFENRHVLFQVRFEFHAELGERSAGDHRDFLGDAGLNQARAVHHRVHRPGAERFGIRAGSILTAGIFGDRFGQIAAAAIIPVADGFLGTTDHVIDFATIYFERVEHRAQRMSGRNFRREIFQQDFRDEIDIFLVSRLERADQSLPE